MGEGIDDHLKDGGSLDDYRKVDMDAEMKGAINKEKAGLPKLIAQIILKNEHFISVNETLYRYEKNVLGGGYYRTLDEREVSIAIQRANIKRYSRKIRDDVKDLLHNHSFIKREKLNAGGGLINLLNGVLDIESGTLRPASVDDYYTHQIPIRHDVNASYSEWLRVLGEIFEPNPDNILLIQQIFGYCLQNVINEDKFFIFCGNGANGKGVITHILSSLIGINNISALGLEKIGDSRWSECLVGKILNLATESDSRASRWAETMKTAVSGEPLMVNPKYKPAFLFKPTAKHIITMNEPPYIEDKSDGVVRRMIVVPFKRTFAESEQDYGLKKRLIEIEGSGILNWAIEGFRNYLKNGFIVPDENRRMVADIKRDSNTVMLFAEDSCDVLDVFDRQKLDKDGFDYDYIPTKEFYSKYRDWCGDSGHKPYSLTKVSRIMNANYDIQNKLKKINGNVFRAYFGLRWVI